MKTISRKSKLIVIKHFFEQNHKNQITRAKIKFKLKNLKPDLLRFFLIWNLLFIWWLVL